VIDAAPERTQAAPESVLSTFTAEQRQGACAVAADMLPAYAQAVARQPPNAEMADDKIDVAKHLGEAVDQVPRTENRALHAQDDDRLKGTRQVWLFNKANISPKQRRRFDTIKKHGLKTARFWGITDLLLWLWRHVYSTSDQRFFMQWYAWAAQFRLRPVVKVARMLRRHLPNLLTYFHYAIRNAMNEGYNSVIQALTYAAPGFRSFVNYGTRILFFCGRVDLRPQLPCH